MNSEINDLTELAYDGGEALTTHPGRRDLIPGSRNRPTRWAAARSPTVRSG